MSDEDEWMQHLGSGNGWKWMKGMSRGEDWREKKSEWTESKKEEDRKTKYQILLLKYLK